MKKIIKIVKFKYFRFSIDTKTVYPKTRGKPDTPSIQAETILTDDFEWKVKIKWLPNFTNELPGSHFYVAYRERDGKFWHKTDIIKSEDFVIFDSLNPRLMYEFKIVSVDDNLETESETIEYPPVQNPVLKFMTKTNCAKYVIDIPSLFCRSYEYVKQQIGKYELF